MDVVVMMWASCRNRIFTCFKHPANLDIVQIAGQVATQWASNFGQDTKLAYTQILRLCSARQRKHWPRIRIPAMKGYINVPVCPTQHRNRPSICPLISGKRTGFILSGLACPYSCFLVYLTSTSIEHDSSELPCSICS